jgi:hypothetical protein
MTNCSSPDAIVTARFSATRITSNAAGLNIIKRADFLGMIDPQVRIIFSKSENQIGSLDNSFSALAGGVL